jgi:hypothetical protein
LTLDTDRLARVETRSVSGGVARFGTGGLTFRRLEDRKRGRELGGDEGRYSGWIDDLSIVRVGLLA